MITDRLAVIHMPRTGGTALRHYLREVMQKRLRWVGDLGHRLLADVKGFLEVPIWGVVRNPWEWYVSRYFARGWVPFPGRELGATFEEHIRQGFDVPGFSWSDSFQHYFSEADGRCGLTKLLRFERLGEEVESALSALDIEPLPWSLVPKMRCCERQPGEHWTPELRQLVARCDAGLLKRLEYA